LLFKQTKQQLLIIRQITEKTEAKPDFITTEIISRHNTEY